MTKTFKIIIEARIVPSHDQTRVIWSGETQTIEAKLTTDYKENIKALTEKSGAAKDLVSALKKLGNTYGYSGPEPKSTKH